MYANCIKIGIYTQKKTTLKLGCLFSRWAFATALLGDISDRYLLDCKQNKCNEGVINNIYLQKKDSLSLSKGSLLVKLYYVLSGVANDSVVWLTSFCIVGAARFHIEVAKRLSR